MDLGSIFLILALLVVVALFVGRPLMESAKVVGDKAEGEDHQHSMLLAERDRILNALQELDFDHTLGKIPEEDYPPQRNMLLHRGANILRELDALAVEDHQETAEDRLEAAIAARRVDQAQAVAQSSGSSTRAPAPVSRLESRAGRPAPDDDLEMMLAQRKRLRQDKAAGFCSQCGAPIQQSDHFCPKCGSKTA
jgi:hypothetical protein